MAGEARRGGAWPGEPRRGMAGTVRFGVVGLGKARQDKAGMAGRGEDRHGEA